MTYRELLELAAKAAGYNMAKVLDGYPMYMEGYGIWNPLTDDGDALRLAVKLGIDIEFFLGDPSTVDAKRSLGAFIPRTEFMKDDPYAATRRAIVRAAAEIGKNA
jgi:hypothetical protein